MNDFHGSGVNARSSAFLHAQLSAMNAAAPVAMALYYHGSGIQELQMNRMRPPLEGAGLAQGGRS
jgi:hypothetical protein